jgi:pimeloyl-ACP methyl ester carboxylesterase
MWLPFAPSTSGRHRVFQLSMNLVFQAADLHVNVDGPANAPALVLWNGAFCSLRMWDNMVPTLARTWRVVRFDIRGTGKSRPAANADTQYRLEQYSLDTSAILESLGISTAHHLAMAWGVRAAIVFGSHFPRKILSLSLFDASIEQPDPEAQKTGARAALARQVANGVPFFDKPPGWNKHDDMDTAQLAMAATRGFDFQTALPKLDMPVLVATGDFDPNLEPSRRLAQRIAQARLVVMKDVGHASVLQRPDLTLQTFLNFQQSLEALP